VLESVHARRLQLEEVIAALGYEPVGFDEPGRAAAACRAAPERFDAALVCAPPEAGPPGDCAGAIHRAAPRLPIILATAAHACDAGRLATAGIAEVVPYPPTSAQLAVALARRLSTGAQGTAA